MIVSLIIGKHKSVGVPGKNYKSILGRPMVEYRFLAAQNSDKISKIFVSTDSPDIKEVAKNYNVNIIDRPKRLATPDALTEDALVHAFERIEEICDNEVEMISIGFANAPHVLSSMIDEGVNKLKRSVSADSVVSVSKYNMFTPLRARRINEKSEKEVESYIDLGLVGNENELTSIRGSAGNCYYEDFAVQIIRRRCLNNIEDGEPPFRWLGSKSLALENTYGFDVDAEWQIPVIKKWLTEHGFTRESTPY